MKKQISLTEGNVISSLVQFTFPILAALLLQVMYGTVDLLVVGNFAQVSDISGVTIGSQIMQTLTSLCTGLAMGTTVLLGQKIGEKKEKEASYTVCNSIYIFSVLAIVIMVLLLVFHKQVVALMNTPTEAIVQTKQYLIVCTIGIPMIFAYNVLGSIFRGIGDSKTPFIAVAIACVVNVIGDIICVYGFGLGAMGAAIATVLAQTVSVIISVVIIIKKSRLPFHIHKKDMRVQGYYCKKVLLLGLPIALQSVLVSVSFLGITIIVNDLGVVYSAAVGLSEKISGFIMLVPIAFMQSLSVFVAQNYGAKRAERAKTGLKWALIISFIYGVIMALLAYFKGDYLAMIFNNSSDVIFQTKEYLRAYAIDTLLVPIMFCMTGFFNGCGRTTFVMIQGIIGAIAIRVPLSFLFSLIAPVSLFRIGLATPAATLLQIIMCVVFYYYMSKKHLLLSR